MLGDYWLLVKFNPNLTPQWYPNNMTSFSNSPTTNPTTQLNQSSHILYTRWIHQLLSLHGYELWAGGTSLPTRIKKSQNMCLHHFAFQPAAFYLLLSRTTYKEIAQLPGAHWKSLWIEALLRHLSLLGLCWHPTQPKIGQLQGARWQLL